MASQLRHGGNDESPNSEEIIESSVCSEHEVQNYVSSYKFKLLIVSSYNYLALGMHLSGALSMILSTPGSKTALG